MSAGDMCQPPTQMESKAPKEVLGKNVCACGECEGGGGPDEGTHPTNTKYTSTGEGKTRVATYESTAKRDGKRG